MHVGVIICVTFAVLANVELTVPDVQADALDASGGDTIPEPSLADEVDDSILPKEVRRSSPSKGIQFSTEFIGPVSPS